eukprot:5818871-Amphidinium_carterae.1
MAGSNLQLNLSTFCVCNALLVRRTSHAMRDITCMGNLLAGQEAPVEARAKAVRLNQRSLQRDKTSGALD